MTRWLMNLHPANFWNRSGHHLRSLRISSRPLRVREIPQRREEYSVEHSLDHLPAERVPRFTTRLSEQCTGCYNSCVPQVPSASAVLSGHSPSDGNRDRVTQVHPGLADSRVRIRSGQVAQVVERSPEKAGVGGSTPSLATIIPPNIHAGFRGFCRIWE